MAGAVIKRYRLQAGIDQGELADLLQVSQSQMSRLESGLVPLTPAQLFFLADYFNAPDILLEYIQPFLDRAMDMTGASVVSPPEKYLIALLRETIDEIEATVSGDRRSAALAATQLVALAQVVLVLVSR